MLAGTDHRSSVSHTKSPVAILMPLATLRGGCEVMLLNLLRANLTHGQEAYQIGFLEEGPMASVVQEMGYPTRVFNAGRLREWTRYAATVRALATWCQQQGVVHVLSWMEKAHLYGGPAAWLAGASSSWWLHSIDPDSRMMRLITAVPTDHVFSTSRTAAEVQARRWPPREMSVCHGSVDLSRFARPGLLTSLEAKGQLDLPTDRTVVAMVARLQRWKGIDVFIEAAAKVIAASSAPPYFVIIGGDHSLEPGVKTELKARIARLRIEDHFRLAGFQADVPLWMQAADTIVHASTGIEPFGIVIVEALALGKNVIAAKAGGPLEIMTDGVHGRLTPPGDVGALSDAIIASIADTPENARMRQAGRSRALDFSGDAMAATVSVTLRSVIARAKRGAVPDRSPPASRAAPGRLLNVGLVMPLAVRRGGCETQLFNLLTANAKSGRINYSVCFLENGPMVEQVRDLGYAALVVEAGRMRQIGRYLATVRSIRAWIRRERLTRVVSWMEKAHLYAGPAALAEGVPAAWWLRSIAPGSCMLRLLDVIPAAYTFACSTAALDAWKPDWHHRRAGVCYSAVNLDRFNPGELGTPQQARRRLNLPIDGPIVGIVARMQRWKGVDVLLSAAAKLRPDVRPRILVIGGEHTLEPDVLAELQAQAIALGISDRVTFAGYQPDVPLWMQACDVIVHCSTRPEPLGIVIVEAMALGKQIIAADAGGPREVITHGVNGRLTPPGDAAALAAAIDASLVENEANRRMGQGAARRARFFSSDRMADRLADALTSEFRVTKPVSALYGAR